MAKKKIVAAGGVVLNEKGALLIMFRRDKWDLPKGKVDPGESLETAAVREVMEETGLQQVEVNNPVGITYHEYFDHYINETVIKETHWYAMRVKGEPNLIPQTEEDIEKIIWADQKILRECLKNTYPNIREIVEKSGYLPPD